MLGKMEPFGGISFLWTSHYNRHMAFVGHSHGHDEIIFDGTAQLDDTSFHAFYMRNNKVIGIASIGRQTDTLPYMEAMH